jgi:hypothetical protein
VLGFRFAHLFGSIYARRVHALCLPESDDSPYGLSSGQDPLRSPLNWALRLSHRSDHVETHAPLWFLRQATYLASVGNPD